jgi:hypothetical protein
MTAAVALETCDRNFWHERCRRGDNWCVGPIPLLAGGPSRKTPRFDFAGPTRRATDRRPVQPRRTAFHRDQPEASLGPFWDLYSCGLRRNMIATAAIRQVSVSPDQWLDT